MDVKTAQELLRHANAKITLDLYSQAVSSQKREASTLIEDMMLPRLEAAEILSTVAVFRNLSKLLILWWAQ